MNKLYMHFVKKFTILIEIVFSGFYNYGSFQNSEREEIR